MTTTTQTVRQNGEAGFTLLELLLVIGVAALLLIGGIATYRLVSEGNRATEATRLLLTLRQESQQLAQQNGGKYTGIDFASSGAGASTATNVFVASGVLRVGQNNPFNGMITIAPATVTTADDEVTIQFDNVPRASCVKMATAIVDPNEITSVGVGVAGATVMTPAGAGAAALNAVNAAAGCAATNVMIWQVK